MSSLTLCQVYNHGKNVSRIIIVVAEALSDSFVGYSPSATIRPTMPEDDRRKVYAILEVFYAAKDVATLRRYAGDPTAPADVREYASALLLRPWFPWSARRQLFMFVSAAVAVAIALAFHSWLWLILLAI